MKIGISTASLFGRFNTEDALRFLSQNKTEVAEIFLESYCEYNQAFGQLLKQRKGDTEVHSVHVLTTQFEPQLYSVNERAASDSFNILRDAMLAAKEVNAKYYTFHGGARFKKTPFKIDYDKVGLITQRIIDIVGEYGVSLAYENVHWGYYNYVGFFDEIRKRTHGLKGTFDIKQAWQSDVFYGDFISEMGNDLVTAHLSDVKDDCTMCLPGRGKTDFDDVFKRLSDVGFDGSVLIEVYKKDFETTKELFDSVEYLKSIASKYFK